MSDSSDPHMATESALGRAPEHRGLLGRPGLAWGAVILTLAGLSAAFFPSWLKRAHSAPVDAVNAPATRVVSVVHPAHSEDITLTLPANVDAFQTTPLYSRVNGYLVSWHADIGDRVEKGTVLAKIDTPELDQEHKQATANLAQARVDLEEACAELEEAEAGVKQSVADIARAKANLEYSASVLQRNEQLHAQRAISNQDWDECRRDHEARTAELDSANATRQTRLSHVATRTTHIKSHEATVKSLEANLARLEELQGFKTITAPFAGIVIRRRVEVGVLITAGSSSTAQELFALAQADTLRIRLHVPQTQAPSVQIGQAAEVIVPEFADRVFTAKVARTARALDPASRTLMVELELPNAEYTILPGTFGQVRLTVARCESSWSVPASVLLSRPTGLEVAIVAGQNLIELRKIKLGRDYGNRVEVLSGLLGDEQLVVNPPDDLTSGEQVALSTSAARPAEPQGSSVAQAPK